MWRPMIKCTKQPRISTKSVLLSELLSGIVDIPAHLDKSVTDLFVDSRAVTNGSTFVAFGGGIDYIKEAVDKGACVIIRDLMAGESYATEIAGITHVMLKQLRFRIGYIAARYFHYPSRWMKLIGVTGTNGKTSCTLFIAQILRAAGIASGVIGTLGSGPVHDIKAGNLTTPDAVSVQRTLAELRGQGIQAVAMEVSSHALDQGRVNNVIFDIGVFTNLTHEHLDYHGDMTRYGQAKRKLFSVPSLRQAVINLDDEFGLALCKELSVKLQVYGYSIEGRTMPGIRTIIACDMEYSETGIRAEVDTPWGHTQLVIPLLGRFNLSNALATVTVANLMGMSLSEVAARLAQIKGAPGRMQTLGGGDKPLVVVDYAHSPDALEQVLSVLKTHTKGQLFCVFGCGGERDRQKRPLMAKAVARYADRALVTNDNPRGEDPKQIVDEIVMGFDSSYSFSINLNRAAAIHEMIASAQTGDVVLIAGKGHEDYQEIAGQRYPFNDCAYAATGLESHQ